MSSVRTQQQRVLWTAPGAAKPGVHGSSSRTGLTLIELLVVVTIIAFLISILLPSLKRARQAAKVAVCTANLRGIASASLTYATEDAHEQAIPVHSLIALGGDPGAYDWGGKSGRGEQVASNDPTSSIWGTANGFGPGTRALNDIVFKTRFTDYQDAPGANQSNWKNDLSAEMPIYRCPSDRGYTGHHYPMWSESRLSSYDHYGTSYAGNVLMWHGFRNDSNSSVTFGWGSLSPYLSPLSRIRSAANTVYYLENCGRFSWHANYGIAGDDRAFGSMRCGEGLFAAGSGVGIWARAEQPAIVKGWHGRPFNITASFVDGHAASVKMDGRIVPSPQVYRTDVRGRIPWAECWVIRGHGWQMDALPKTGSPEASEYIQWQNTGFVPHTTPIR